MPNCSLMLLFIFLSQSVYRPIYKNSYNDLIPNALMNQIHKTNILKCLTCAVGAFSEDSTSQNLDKVLKTHKQPVRNIW